MCLLQNSSIPVETNFGEAIHWYMTCFLFTFVFMLFTETYTIWNKELRHASIQARVQNTTIQIFVHRKLNLCDVFIK